MQTLTLAEAQTRLPALIEAAARGQTVVITDGDELSVQLVPRATQKRKRQFGSAQGF